MPLARHYKVSEIKQKLLHPAQTSVYAVEILTKRNINNFVGVNLPKDQEAINLACCEASLPGSSLATHEVNNDYHGTSEKMAYRRIYDDTIDLTFYVDYRYNTLKYFLGWMSFIVGEGNYFGQDEYTDPTTFYRMTYPKSYKTRIRLLKFEKDITKSAPKYKIGYNFIDAFPINIASTPISYEQSDLLKVTVSFSYTRYVVKSRFSPYTATARVGPAPSTSPSEQASANSSYFDYTEDLPVFEQDANFSLSDAPTLNTAAQNLVDNPFTTNTNRPRLNPDSSIPQQDLDLIRDEQNIRNSFNIF
jgi:hypothetical protein